MKRQKQLPWRHKPFPELVRLAWPICVSMLSYSLMTLVDTLFVGQLGAAALAGVGVGGIMSFTLMCFGFGLLRALKVLVSQAEGAGQSQRAPGYLAAGLTLALGFGLANILLGWSLSPLLPQVTATAEAADLAAGYVNIRVLSAPAFLLAVALRETFYAQGDAQTPMRATLISNVFNLGLDALFILKLGWGVNGAALASVIGVMGELAFLGSSSIGRDLLRRAREHGFWRLARANLADVWRLGLPLGLQMFFGVGVFALLTALFAAMSENDVAAHQVALQVIHLSFLPAFALGEAASVLAGQAVGADEDQLVRPVARKAMMAAALYTGLCGIVFAVAAEPIADAFVDDPELIALIVKLMYVAAAFQVFDGVNIVARCVLRGAGDVFFAAWVAVGIAWLCGPLFTYLLGFRAGMGVVGGWLGFCVELIVGAGVLWWRLERMGWLPAAQAERAKLQATAERLEKEAAAELSMVPDAAE